MEYAQCRMSAKYEKQRNKVKKKKMTKHEKNAIWNMYTSHTTNTRDQYKRHLKRSWYSPSHWSITCMWLISINSYYSPQNQYEIHLIKYHIHSMKNRQRTLTKIMIIIILLILVWVLHTEHYFPFLPSSVIWILLYI